MKEFLIIAFQALLLIPIAVTVLVLRACGLNYPADEIEDWFIHL